MTFTRQTRCIDCNARGVRTARAAPKPGPRCLECWRARRREVSTREHARRTEDHFGITGDEYWRLYEAQGGRCYVCRRATGKRKRLAVDHDHACTEGHDPKVGCRKCIRALVCGPCNTEVLGRLDREALRRAAHVLKYKPAQQIMMGWD